MFHDTLYLPVKTPNNPFVAAVTIEIIESFIQRVGYQGVVYKTSSPQKSLKVTIKHKQGVKGEKDEESYDDKFATFMLHDDVDDFGDMIELESHKKHLKVVDNDDENKEEKKDDVIGSLENKNEKMQTPIPITPRSLRINLSSNKNIAQELTDTVSLSTTTTSKDPHNKKCISSKYSHLPRALRRMCRRQGYMNRDMERIATNDLFEGNLKRAVTDPVIQERDAFHYEVPDLISKEFNAQAPQIIEELFNNYRVPTIFDRARMEATLNDMFSNQFRNAEEYAYHLEQATTFIENQKVWESRQEDIRLLIPKALVFYGPQWNPNEPPRYLYNKDILFLRNRHTE
uniref:Uncharacterized protein n=1 Tax=Tanacetum cinerariifolium TaxID=118510 RepID=A0A6L2MRG3_TANCI|nr:hypothetical protein [Tanacetum cinerariifolium]